MIIYSSTKKEFKTAILNNEIVEKIQASFVRKIGRRSNNVGMIRSWENSLLRMNNVIDDIDIPDNAGIAIEYRIPQTAKQIDFMITGYNGDEKNVIIVELKQWECATLADEDGLVETWVGGCMRKEVHPSYQAWSYAMLLNDFNQGVQDGHIALKPCAYLHNYNEDDVITNKCFKGYIDQSPVFLRSDAVKLRDFIKKFIKAGDNGDLLYEIENGKIHPSKHLADSLSSMLKGNKEFTLVDDQKVAFESALRLQAKSVASGKRNVLIVKGGPGTGKSVVAINLLVELTKRNQVAQYVTKNSAPRIVFAAKLTGTFKKTYVNNLFVGSGQFIDIDPQSIDALIVDEAHRLNEKSGMFSNLGENQIKEIISASKFSVFFLDEDQKVTFKDIGSPELICDFAKQLGADVYQLELQSQFRCNGSDGYLAWIDNTLGIRETVNTNLEDIDFDFRVVDSPEELHEMIRMKNADNKARVVAGYCWNWVSKRHPSQYDIVIGNYRARWNLAEYGQSWIIQPNSVSEVGCIHTCQGLEVDYIGVIIGDDFVVRDGVIITNASKRASTDQTIKGYKTILKNDPQRAMAMADTIIKNTYRTLMTRGMKGCYIYCVDKETQEYFKKSISDNT